MNPNYIKWIQQARRGDTEAYGKLVNAYQGLVVGWAFHFVSNFEDAQEIAQEVFLEAYMSLSRLKSLDRFGAWLRQIFRCVDWLRRRKDLISLEEITDNEEVPAQLCASEPTPEENAEIMDSAHQVQLALEGLSENHRLVICLAYFSEKSYKEIAEFLDVPVSTVEGRLYRARKQFKEVLTMIQEGTTQRKPDERFTKKVL